MNQNYTNIKYTDRNFLGEAQNFKFRSWSDFQANLKLRKDGNIYFSHYNHSKQTESEGFNDTKSLEEAVQKTKERVEPTTAQKKELFEVQKQFSKMVISDTPFDSIDIPSYLSGGPDHWTGFTSAKRKSQKKVVKTIFLCVNALAGVSTEELSQYLSKSLVEIYSNYVFNQLVITACSKQSGDTVSQFYIDISYREVMLIFRAGFSDFFRRIIFFFKEQYSGLGFGYGRTLTAEDIRDLQNSDNSEVFSFYN